MANGDAGGLDFEDADRLPWLEPAEGEDYGDRRTSLLKILGLVLVGLVLLGMIVGGGFWLKQNGAGTADAPKLIRAQGGDYKIPAEDKSRKSFQGEGDASFATSEGVETAGKVDASRTPEAPLADVSRGSVDRAAAAKADAGVTRAGSSVTVAVRDETRGSASGAHKAAPAAAAAGGPMIQLGAYGSEAGAQAAWKRFSGRFNYLAPLTSSVQKAEVGGATLYRLRASAGSAVEAANLCGRLKVAGENCIVVK